MERPKVDTSEESEKEKEKSPFDVMMGIGKMLKKLPKVETKEEGDIELKKVDVSIISPEIFSP